MSTVLTSRLPSTPSLLPLPPRRYVCHIAAFSPALVTPYHAAFAGAHGDAIFIDAAITPLCCFRRSLLSRHAVCRYAAMLLLIDARCLCLLLRYLFRYCASAIRWLCLPDMPLLPFRFFFLRLRYVSTWRRFLAFRCRCRHCSLYAAA